MVKVNISEMTSSAKIRARFYGLDQVDELYPTVTRKDWGEWLLIPNICSYSSHFDKVWSRCFSLTQHCHLDARTWSYAVGAHTSCWCWEKMSIPKQMNTMMRRRKMESKTVSTMRMMWLAWTPVDTSRASRRKKKKKVRHLNLGVYTEVFSCDSKAGFSQNPQDTHVLLQRRSGPHMALSDSV